jgi:magnesium-transporting ATPase (P-type)
MILKSLIFVALVGIKDPIRSDVPKAVSKILNAGLKMIMITGGK